MSPSPAPTAPPRRYQAILFDLLTALLDSWTVWNAAAAAALPASGAGPADTARRSAAKGREWRSAYLRRTYGCGVYRPYETLVCEAAAETGLDEAAVAALESGWTSLQPWPGVTEALGALACTHRLGVVTNCSERLGRIAADCVGVPFDVVITSERAGFYKPDPHPYQMALEALALPPSRVLFVAGSGYDLFGTARIGLDTYWHNRVGLPAPEGAPAPLMERPTLDDLPLLALRRE